MYKPIRAALHSCGDTQKKPVSQVDAVEADGDEEIKSLRNEIGRDIKAILSELDRKKDDRWQKQKEVSSVSGATAPQEDNPNEIVEPADAASEVVSPSRDLVLEATALVNVAENSTGSDTNDSALKSDNTHDLA